ncbi:MAG: polysaccharide biosynthesis protein [Eubacteriales bacterium]
MSLKPSFKHRLKILLATALFVGGYIISALISSAVVNNFNLLGAMPIAVPVVVGSIIIICFVFATKLNTCSFYRASIPELTKTFALCAVLFLVNLVIGLSMETVDLEWCFVNFLLYFFISFIMVFSLRFLAYLISKKNHMMAKNKENALIVGAGEAGVTILREMMVSDKIKYNVVGFIDDDLKKVGSYILGIPVVTTVDKIPDAVEKMNVKTIVIAIPTAPAPRIKEILNVCMPTKCQVKILPGIYQLLNEQVSVSRLRDVDVQDLLGREPVKTNIDEVIGYIKDQVVLVTGGGGSIGSELCRQIAAHGPKQLIILDIYENNAYEIQQELKRKYPDLNLVTLIASIRDSVKMDDVFDKYRPDIVFHAAAHKHVPLMETSPNEAVKNNIIGTYKVVKCADKYGVKTFVQISTDKAVNPTNIMGATKRVCEMIIQTYAKKSKTRFTAVRFGNVLGSNGSVIPLFKKQISEGGPVTVTHKDIIRYFMTIPEAVSLVLQAGAYAKGGEIFVLDMGEQVRIYDLAKNLIRLSGYEPDKDIKIVFTGLRPGEKLYEERLMAEEGLEKTANNRISIGKPLDIDEDKLFSSLEKLYDAAYHETDHMKELVHELVPTYRIDTEHEGK